MMPDLGGRAQECWHDAADFTTATPVAMTAAHDTRVSAWCWAEREHRGGGWGLGVESSPQHGEVPESG